MMKLGKGEALTAQRRQPLRHSVGHQGRIPRRRRKKRRHRRLPLHIGGRVAAAFAQHRLAPGPDLLPDLLAGLGVGAIGGRCPGSGAE